MAKFPTISWRGLTGIMLVAAILYDLWPLGYALNPRVGRYGLASELEGLGQPYNWVFIVADIVSSLLVLIVVYALWQRAKGHSKHWVRVAVWCLGAFAVLTALDALLPLPCAPSVRHCSDLISDPLTLAHGSSSIAATSFLFISLLVLWWKERRQNWWLYLLMTGYIIFALLSLIALLHPGRDSWAQHYYITLCALWMALAPSAVRKALTP